MRTTAIEWEISNQYMRTVTLVIKSLSLSTDLKDTALKLDVVNCEIRISFYGHV